MKTLRIDGREVTVADGTTVLEAARSLGLQVPSLCHRPGFDCATSCMVCVVRIDRGRGFTPSCATVVRDGMEVECDSEPVRAARRNSLLLLLTDHAGDCVAPCQLADDRHANLPDIIRRVGAGDLRGAAAAMAAAGFDLDNLPPDFARRGQKACRRGRIDEGLAIERLLRCVAEHRDDAPADATATPPPLPEPYRAWSVRLGKMSEQELRVLQGDAPSGPQTQPADAARGFTVDEAKAEAQRCLHCDCRAAPTCVLRKACADYGVDVSMMPAARPELIQDRSHPEILFEPGKCIRCGLCLQVAARHGETFGLMFRGRGFEMHLDTPFREPLAKALAKSGGACADVCPTAALVRRDGHPCGQCGGHGTAAP